MTRWLFSIFAAALMLAGCSAGTDTKAAEAGVDNFHRAMDAGQYATIYDASTSDMKTSITRDDFIKMLEGVHGKMGAYKSGKTTGWNVNVGTDGHVVSLNREVQFERGPATEEFVFRIDGERAKLAGWHITSNLLVTG